MIARPARFLLIVALVALVHAAVPVGAQLEPGRMLVIKAAAVTLPAGGSAEAIMTITLLPDYEILASPPPTQWATGASLAVVSSGDVVAKTAVFPAPQMVRDEDGGKEIPVWTSTIEVRVPLEAAAKAAPGDKSLSGRLRYQAHFKGEYYRVATRDFEIPVKVVKAKKGSGTAGAPATRP